MTEPAILTTVVGSYPAPAWLLARPGRQALRDALYVVLKTQELAGIDLPADGELYRFDLDHPETNGMIDFFLRPLRGVRTRLTLAELEDFRAAAGTAYRAAPAGLVEGPLGPGTLGLPAAWEEVRAAASGPLKFTLTGPHMLAKVVGDRYYGHPAKLAAALAEILAEQVARIDAAVVQVDEANITGHPDEAGWAAEALNRVLEAIGGTPAVHLCFGNYGGQTIQRGTWAALTDYLNALRVDHVVLETARRPPEELDALRAVRPEIGLGIGVIDVKDLAVETADQVAARLERAAAVLGADRLRYAHPDCGLWMLPRSVADAKLRALVAGRDRFLGRGQST